MSKANDWEEVYHRGKLRQRRDSAIWYGEDSGMSPTWYNDPYRISPYFADDEETRQATWGFPDEISDDMVDKLWARMYEKPILNKCSHCDSGNVVTNGNCVQCGAPMKITGKPLNKSEE